MNHSEQHKPHLAQAKGSILRWYERGKKVHPRLPDTQQRWWQSGSIQFAGATSLPVILIGTQLASSVNFANAVTSIILGNLFLLVLGIIIIQASGAGRKNTLEVVRTFVGPIGALLMALALLGIPIGWFPIQAMISGTALLQCWGVNASEFPMQALQVGAILSVLTACLGIFGIRGIKWITVAFSPILIAFFVYSFIYIAPSEPAVDLPRSFSLSGLAIVVGITLPAIVDLPTFFRHNKSQRHSFASLIAFILLGMLLEIFGAYMGGDLRAGHESIFGEMVLGASTFLTVFYVAFLIMSNVAVNLNNIYAGSVAWEVLVPRVVGKQEYFIVGLVGLASLVVFQSKGCFVQITEVADIMLGSIGAVLCFSYIFNLALKRKITRGEQMVNLLSWVLGIILGLGVYTELIPLKVMPIFAGIVTSVLVQVVVFGSILAVHSLRARR